MNFENFSSMEINPSRDINFEFKMIISLNFW